MPIKRLTIAAALVSVLLVSGPLQAAPGTAEAPAVASLIPVSAVPQLLSQLSAFNPAPTLAQSVVPSSADILVATGEKAVAAQPAAVNVRENGRSAAAGIDVDGITDLRKALISLAMNLRNIRYVRGGRDPSTGFDCSGFVRYVFAHAIGMQLPTNSASQFLAGLKVSRDDMKPGDLVFFHTHGKRRISHVGIYISDGEFIHSPASGESVQISSLNDAYWAKHFAGAKRPQAIAMVEHNG